MQITSNTHINHTSFDFEKDMSKTSYKFKKTINALNNRRFLKINLLAMVAIACVCSILAPFTAGISAIAAGAAIIGALKLLKYDIKKLETNNPDIKTIPVFYYKQEITNKLCLELQNLINESKISCHEVANIYNKFNQIDSLLNKSDSSTTDLSGISIELKGETYVCEKAMIYNKGENNFLIARFSSKLDPSYKIDIFDNRSKDDGVEFFINKKGKLTDETPLLPYKHLTNTSIH